MHAPSRRELLIVLCNAILASAILYMCVGGLIESRRFVGQLSHYGFTANPLLRDILWLARAKWFDLVCACALILGGVAELRRANWAALLNPVIYAAQVASTLWYAILPNGSREIIPPIALAVAILFGLIPTVGLFLYRQQITQLLRRQKQPEHGGSH